MSEASNGQHLLTEAQRKELVLSYLALTDKNHFLDWQIKQIYADPAVSDPATESAELVAEQVDVRAKLGRLQPMAEGVLEEQVSAVLADEGFGIAGQLVPPVSMQMTPLPAILIVSPRDRVEQIYSVPIQPGLSVPAIEAVESNIYNELDRSALVVPIAA